MDEAVVAKSLLEDGAVAGLGVEEGGLGEVEEDYLPGMGISVFVREGSVDVYLDRQGLPLFEWM